jgi:heptosyltransferase-2
MQQGRILVIRGGAIGDFILTLPVLSALRQHFPRAQIELLGYPHIAELARAGGLVDQVQAIEARGLAGFFASGGALDERLRTYFAGFDLILSYLYDPDDIFKTNVAACTEAQFIQGPHRPDESEGLHATEVLLQPLQRLAVFDVDTRPRLKVAGGAVAPATLALHPGSGSERKNWPESRWAELLRRLMQETTKPVLLVGGEAEGERLERLAAEISPGRVSVARSRPLVELAGMLQGCCGFVGHDSGITHLAAALGVPCVVLWADTALEVWQPQGTEITILSDPGGLAGLAVESVLALVR